MLKRTQLYPLHLELGARMVPFAGWKMPVQYEGIIPEHLWVRKSAGLFDVSHMGEIEVRGPDGLRFISYITSNDPSKLATWQVQYSCFPNEKGGAVDDLLVYRLPDRWLLVVNAANKDKDLNWIRKWARGFDVEVEDVSDRVAELALQGPKAQEALSGLAEVDLDRLEYYWATEAEVMGKRVLISRTGYTGEDGFEIYVYDDPDFALELARRLLADQRVKPAGLGARDTLRLEAGYILYGNDLTDDINILEAGLGWITSFDKGDFVGRDALLKAKEKGLRLRRIGFRCVERGPVPRHGNPVFRDGQEVGWVSSGAPSPSLGYPIGMAYVPRDVKPGEELVVEVRPGREVKVQRVKMPFVRGSVRK